MKPTPELIEKWRKQARADLENARLTTGIGAHYVCVLLCQQAAEKMLKAAYMAVKGEEAPFTHNLAALLRALGSPADILAESTTLTTDYLGTRYPPLTDAIPAETYGEAESVDRLARAERITEWAEGLIDGALGN